MSIVFALAIGFTFAVGLYQLLRRNVIRSAIGLVIIGNAINLYLLCAGRADGVNIPYSTVTDAGYKSDSFPQALILTAIVISMGGFAFILALLYMLVMRKDTADTADLTDLKH